MTDVTRILNAIEGGNAKAANELIPLVYEELRILASQKLSQEKPGQTLQATSLVHEAYLRLVSSEGQNWDNRGHFFKAAAESMRRILVENARRKNRLKRGGDRERAAFQDATIAVETPSVDLVALDEALAKLEAEDPIRANVVKLRYFAGLTIQQTAKLLNISTATADRHWACARSWLFREISKGD
jgi:RNA polymerase sigma factor (TIGR02999 family)